PAAHRRAPLAGPARQRHPPPGGPGAVTTSFVLGVDLDGVCADYTRAFAEVVAAERGCRVEDLPAERSWDFAEWDLDSLGGFERLHRIAVLEKRMFRTMPVVPGCAAAL